MTERRGKISTSPEFEEQNVVFLRCDLGDFSVRYNERAPLNDDPDAREIVIHADFIDPDRFIIVDGFGASWRVELPADYRRNTQDWPQMPGSVT